MCLEIPGFRGRDDAYIVRSKQAALGDDKPPAVPTNKCKRSFAVTAAAAHRRIIWSVHVCSRFRMALLLAC